jgi:hypothetical protein
LNLSDEECAVVMRVDIDGAAALVNRLKKFDADVYKILQRELKDAAGMVAENARSRVPAGGALSNWGPWDFTTGSNGSVGVVTMVTGSRDLGFSGSRARSGIRPQAVTRSNRGAVSSFKVRVVQMNAAGAIYELAGSQNRSGSTFGPNLNSAHGSGPWPRTLTPAWHAKGQEAGDAIIDALDRAKSSVD